MKYKHFKGGIYNYICDALLEWNDKQVVVYEDDAGRRWVRPRDEFYGMLEFDGEFIQRFVKVEEE